MPDEFDNLEWMNSWYRRQCDGDWEHTRGLHLDPIPDSTKATPGWRLVIELRGTDAADATPRSMSLESVDGGWLECSIDRRRFEGRGDSSRLESIIGVFRRWVECAPMDEVELLELEAAAAR